MKRKHFVFLSLGLLLAGGIALNSCTENEENTIVPIGTEYYIDDIISVIPDTLRDDFFADFGNIPEGPIPPKIEGSYVMGPKQRVASNLEGWPLVLPIPEDNVNFRFSEQHNELVKMELREAENEEVFTDTVFVCGNGNAFTVYCIEEKSITPELFGVTYHAKITRGIVMKGRMASDGIEDFRYATIVLDSEDDYNGAMASLEKGTYFIYKDGNGKAENCDW